MTLDLYVLLFSVLALAVYLLAAWLQPDRHGWKTR